MTKRRAGLIVAVVIAAVGLSVLALGGPDPEAVPTTDDVAERTMSPYCEGLTLQECPTSQSRELRAELARKISSGWTNAQIDRWLVDNYGQQVLGYGHPLARLIPAAGAVLGLVIVIMFLRRTMSRGSTPTGEVDDEDLTQVRLELEHFRKGSTE